MLDNKKLLKNANSLLIMLIGLFCGLFFFTFRVTDFSLLYFPGDLGDARLNLFFFEHNYKFFLGKLSGSYWDIAFMYPEKNVMGYSDNLLGTAPIYALFRLFGINEFTAYQLWFVVVSALNYIAAFYFLKYIFKNNYSAVLGAMIFAFSLAMVSQLPHAQTFPRFAIPITLFFVVKYHNTLNPKYFFLTLLFFVYQVYCGMYLGFLLLIPLIIILCLIWIKDLKNEKKILKFKYWWQKHFAYGLINLALLIPLLIHYSERKQGLSIKHYKQIINTIPSLKSYFYSNSDSLIWKFLSNFEHSFQNAYNHQIFPGMIAIIAFGIMLFVIFSKIYKTKFSLSKLNINQLLLITGFFTFILFLRFGNISLYLAVYGVPGMASIRDIARIINVELIFFAMCVSYIFTKIFTKKRKYNFVIFILALSLIIIDNYAPNITTKTSKIEAQQRTERLEKVFSQIPKNSVVSYEPHQKEDGATSLNIDAMLISQKYDLKCLNGYTGSCQKEYLPYQQELNEDGRNAWLEFNGMRNFKLYVVKSENELLEVEY